MAYPKVARLEFLPHTPSTKKIHKRAGQLPSATAWKSREVDHAYTRTRRHTIDGAASPPPSPLQRGP